MLEKYEKISKKFNDACDIGIKETEKTSKAISEMEERNKKTLDNLQNVNIIIADIDKQFKEKTGIVNPKDQAFLWSAVAIQCARWILIPTFDEETLSPDKEGRKDSNSEGKKDKTASGKELEENKDQSNNNKYPNSKNIIALPVPYDAMQGTDDIVIPGVTPFGSNINGHNHHAATLGHDPIIGQIIGTANIMTRSITFHDTLLTTRKVEIPPTALRNQIVVKNPPYSIFNMFKDVAQSTMEEKKRILAALIKENLHLQSDKYTNKGLPIPFLSAELQEKLLNQNWNSAALEEVIRGALKGTVINFILAWLTNTIVGTLHGFCYNEKRDESLKLYSVRTRKIVATSNVIAESINLAAVATGTISGVVSGNPDLVKKSISHLDIGGMIETIHRVFSSKKLQEEIRREFLEQELFNRFTDNKYSFLEESYHE